MSTGENLSKERSPIDTKDLAKQKNGTPKKPDVLKEDVFTASIPDTNLKPSVLEKKENDVKKMKRTKILFRTQKQQKMKKKFASPVKQLQVVHREISSNYEDRVKELREERDVLKERLCELEDELSRKTQQCILYKSQNEDLIEMKENINEKYETQISDMNKHHEKELNELHEMNEKLHFEIEKRRKEIEKLKKTNKRILETLYSEGVQKVKQSSEELDGEGEGEDEDGMEEEGEQAFRNSDMYTLAKELSRANDVLRVENNRVTREKNELKHELEMKNKQIVKLKEEKMEDSNRIVKLERSKLDMKEKMDMERKAKEDEIYKHSQKIEFLEYEKKIIVAENEKMTDSLYGYSKDDDMHGELEAFGSKLFRRKSGFVSLFSSKKKKKTRKKPDVLKVDHEMSFKLIKELQKGNVALEKKYNIMKERNEVLEKERVNREKNIQSFVAEIAKLNKEKQKSDGEGKEIEDLKHVINKLKRKNKGSSERNEDVSEYSSLQKKYEMEKCEKEELFKQLKKLKDESKEKQGMLFARMKAMSQLKVQENLSIKKAINELRNIEFLRNEKMTNELKKFNELIEM